MRLNALQRRRIANFRSNRRAFWSLWIFLALFLVTLCAEFVANDKPILVWFRGELKMPIFHFYSERDFGGEFATEAEYPSPEVRCLIRTGGLEACLDDPLGIYGSIRCCPSEAQRLIAVDAVCYSRDKAKLALDAACSSTSEARRYWNMVFNGYFPA